MNTLFPVVIFWYIKLLNMMNDKINDEKSKGRTQSLLLSILAFWWGGGGGLPHENSLLDKYKKGPGEGVPGLMDS